MFDGVLLWAATAAAELGIPRYAFTGTGCFMLLVQRSLLLHTPQERVTSPTESFLVPGLVRTNPPLRSGSAAPAANARADAPAASVGLGRLLLSPLPPSTSRVRLIWGHLNFILHVHGHELTDGHVAGAGHEPRDARPGVCLRGVLLRLPLQAARPGAGVTGSRHPLAVRLPHRTVHSALLAVSDVSLGRRRE
ncbi:hypothetical protein VPH35_031392 [Triticum aestivum]